MTEYVINGGSPESGATQITVTEGDVLSLGILPDGKTFSIAGPNGNNKNLDLNDLEISGITLADGGIYTFTAEEGCNIILEVIVNELIVDDTDSLKSVIIYPNPVRGGILKFDFKNLMDEELLIGFYDIYGKLVYQAIFGSSHAMEEQLDISIFSDGIYIVEIKKNTTNESVLKKIIKLQ